MRLLCWFLKPELAEEVLGDLDEKFYSQVERHSYSRARKNYWYQVLHYLRPFAFKKINTQKLNFLTMFKHNIKISYRSFLRFKSTFLINLTGLASGLACALLIYLWVVDELSMDKFHEKGDQIYQILQNAETANGVMTFDWTPGLLGPTLMERFPEVEIGTTVLKHEYFEVPSYLIYEENYFDVKEQYIDEHFFDVFSFDMLIGTVESIMEQPDNVLISQQLARTVFGSEDQAIGKVISFENDELEQDYVVSGIFVDPPKSSTMEFEVLFNVTEYAEANAPWYTRWNSNNLWTYVILKEGTDLAQFNKDIYNLVEQFEPKAGSKLITQKYDERYLNGLFEDGKVVGGRKSYVQLFSLVGLVVLIIACINFMNLSTAKANTRLKELGVKKALGALRNTLIAQYYTEALMITFIAAIASLLMATLALPFFNQLTGKALVLAFDSKLISGFIAIVLLTTIISGSYPALYLSRLKTLSSLKGKLSGGFGDLWIRKGLVVFQFGITVILIVSVLVISNQIEYIQNKNLGYSRENVLIFTNSGMAEEEYPSFVNELKNIPGILETSTAGHNLTGDYGRTGGLRWPGQEEGKRLSFLNLETGPDFIETLGIEVVEGRSVDRNRTNEFDKILLNETAIEKMGLENPVGVKVKLWGRDKTIIGIVKDFNVRSLYSAIEPTIIHPVPEMQFRTFVKLQSANMNETLEKIESLFDKFSGGAPYEPAFADQAYERMYAGEKQVAALSKSFALVAILISCLGLFGLTAFTAERRAKEIGIRKVLGAEVWRIVTLLSGDFSKMVLLSLLIALPVSYLVANQWIQNFAFAIDLGPSYFMLAGLIAFILAWLTVGIQTLKAARANPVDSLRSE